MKCIFENTLCPYFKELYGIVISQAIAKILFGMALPLWPLTKNEVKYNFYAVLTCQEYISACKVIDVKIIQVFDKPVMLQLHV